MEIKTALTTAFFADVDGDVIDLFAHHFFRLNVENDVDVAIQKEGVTQIDNAHTFGVVFGLVVPGSQVFGKLVAAFDGHGVAQVKNLDFFLFDNFPDLSFEGVGVPVFDVGHGLFFIGAGFSGAFAIFIGKTVEKVIKKRFPDFVHFFTGYVFFKAQGDDFLFLQFAVKLAQLVIGIMVFIT